MSPGYDGPGDGFSPPRIIEKKRTGDPLSPSEVRAFFQAYLSGEVPDYQMSAFLMAVYFRGMDPDELDTLLDLMISSGSVLDLAHLPGPVVDKHSTGGVGDKVSLVLAPLAAELGLFVPMVSGRGLGHTAGTLDKLEAIPGFRTDLTIEEMKAVLAEVGVAMVGQSAEIAPLDRRLYALRNVTSTVPSIPLIAASIVSKKVAEGIEALVLDVKTGAGSFVPDGADSRGLAETMIALAGGRGVRTTAYLTAMSAPLGRAIGNGLETQEALRCLRGDGPADLAELSTTLVGEMLYLGGLAPDPKEGKRQAAGALSEGKGLGRMARLVERQGGDPWVVEEPDRIPRAPHSCDVSSEESGFVQEVRPLPLGHGVVALGGGRHRMDDPLDPRVGFILHVEPGIRVEAGDVLGEVRAGDQDGLNLGRRVIREAVVVGPEPCPPPGPLVGERLVPKT